ncbi:uncharacterized protein BcabD6B2_15640 [Babesia caballi]|uniref:Uncharacterized protein n=1 Tax=Babesia caballi TaxID=5871 RepID=A0AAV4LTV3_BABCB|nr:hypothetical protein BcabD6B2_15640 [Babesia caballi]
MRADMQGIQPSLTYFFMSTAMPAVYDAVKTHVVLPLDELKQRVGERGALVRGGVGDDAVQLDDGRPDLEVELEVGLGERCDQLLLGGFRGLLLEAAAPGVGLHEVVVGLEDVALKVGEDHVDGVAEGLPRHLAVQHLVDALEVGLLLLEQGGDDVALAYAGLDERAVQLRVEHDEGLQVRLLVALLDHGAAVVEQVLVVRVFELGLQLAVGGEDVDAALRRDGDVGQVEHEVVLREVDPAVNVLELGVDWRGAVDEARHEAVGELGDDEGLEAGEQDGRFAALLRQSCGGCGDCARGTYFLRCYPRRGSCCGGCACSLRQRLR